MESYINQEDEIDLVQLIKNIWKDKTIILKFAFFLGMLGVLVAFLSEKEFTARTLLIPQVSGGNRLGNLGGLAAMAGINVGKGNSDAISPMLYPKIVSSIPFKRALINTPLNIEGVEGTITYKDYYEKYHKPSTLSYVKKYTIGLPSVIIGSIKGVEVTSEVSSMTKDSIYKISVKEKALFNKIDSQLLVSFTEKEGVVKVVFSMPEPLAAAQMTKSAQFFLQNAITKLKVQKIKGELDFIQNRYDEVKKDFINKQSVLASYKDKNQGTILFRSQTRLQQLQSSYNLSFGLYSELAKQLETQKIKLKENTPVFTVIDPVSIPTEKSKPKRLMIIVIWVGLGVILGVSKILINGFIEKTKL